MAGDATIVTGMAGRYASALFDLAKEAGAVDEVHDNLKRFDALIAESADLQRLVTSPVFSADEQLRAVSAVLDRAGIGGLAGNFIKLVASNRRLFAVRGMIAGYSELVRHARGEVTAEVTVAEPLSDRHMESIGAALREVTGKDVLIAVRVDPAILGGLVVRLGSRMVDSSLRTKLNSIKNAMKEVG